jgi:hypothetical protein
VKPSNFVSLFVSKKQCRHRYLRVSSHVFIQFHLLTESDTGGLSPHEKTHQLLLKHLTGQKPDAQLHGSPYSALYSELLDYRVKKFAAEQMAKDVIYQLRSGRVGTTLEDADIGVMNKCLNIIAREGGTNAASIWSIGKKLQHELGSETSVTPEPTITPNLESEPSTSSSDVPQNGSLRTNTLSIDLNPASVAHWAKLHQFIFRAISLITLVYDASKNPEINTFQLSLPKKSRQAGSEYQERPVWKKFKCPINIITVNDDLRRIFLKFGTFQPREYVEPVETVCNMHKDLIVAFHLNVKTLSRLGGVEIEWVNSLNLHLEFCEKSFKLRVFAYSSLCRMLCDHYDGKTFLSK